MAAPEAFQNYCRRLDEDKDAFFEREKIYAFVRDKKFRGIGENAVTQFRNSLFIDHKFNVEVLLHANPDSIQKYLHDLAETRPVEAEALLIFATTQLLEAKNYNLAVRVLAYSLLKIGLDPSASQLHTPWLKTLLLKFPGDERLAAALKVLHEQNSVLASKLASGFLRVFTVNKLPCAAILKFKRSTRFGQNDLYYGMFALSYQKDPVSALELYDGHPELHTKKTLQPLIFAAAQSGAYQRLQETFEAIKLSDRTSYQYETVLQAVGKLGGLELLESLESVAKSTKKTSLGFYHALIYSYGVLGEIGHVQRAFKTLCDHYTPERKTFTLILSSLKDSTELQYSFELIESMVAEHKIPLTNHELSQLLAMCRPRKETNMAKSIFKWAQTLFEPDLASWNAYLGALVEQPHEAWEAAQRMPHTPDIATFTTLLSHCSRYGNADIGAKVLAAKAELELRSDERWTACLLAYQVRLGQKQAETTFKILNTRYKKRSEYFGVLLDLYLNAKAMDKARGLIDSMFKQKVEPGIAFYEKYLRYLVLEGSKSGVQSAFKVAQDLLLKGQFDPDSRLLPRDQLPVTAIKPVIRALLKANSPVRAETLLQLAELKGVQPWVTAGLWMEISTYSREYDQTLKWWQTFQTSLRSVFTMDASTVPRSLRKVYSTHIESLIETLICIQQYEKALELPRTLEKLGLEFTTNNWNTLVKGLLGSSKDELVLEAFKIAESTLSRNWLESRKGGLIQPLLDGRTIRKLHSSMPKLVDMLSSRDGTTRQNIWKRIPQLYKYTLAVFKQCT